MMKLPATKKEHFYFGLMMCIGMVIMMTSYNVITNGLIGKVSLIAIITQFVLGFIIAFLLELFIVGPTAQRIVFSITRHKSGKMITILAMSFCMVTGMVFFMSMYGLVSAYLSHHLAGEPLLGSYFAIFLKNFVFAFPLQLLIMGPLVRFLFGKIKTSRLKQSLTTV